MGKRISVGYKKFGGGLNTTSGPLGLQDNESPDLQNVDFDKSGSVIQRKGYRTLNTSAIAANKKVTGIYWFEKQDGGETSVAVCNSSFFAMNALNGTWNDKTGGLTISITNQIDWETFLDTTLATDNVNVPFKWTGTGDAAVMTVPTGLSRAKFVKEFQNYSIFANVAISGVEYNSRFYHSTIKTIDSWSLLDFYDVGKEDGQDIAGIHVLGDKLVVFKDRSIYNVFFTGSNAAPFSVVKSNSSVGCVSHWSIQEVDNGLVFLARDGLYFYDGNNSFKISDRITSTLITYPATYLTNAVSMVLRTKNQYMLGLTGSGTTNNKVLVWDYFNNSFSIYTGMNAASMGIFFVSGTDERPYFGDYKGFVYRGNIGDDDYPENTKTSINAYYYTNWKSYDELMGKKGVGKVVVYYATVTGTMSFSYSYDLTASDTYTSTFDMSTGNMRRRDLTGRGRVVRFKFANATATESFRIDGLGTMPFLETTE